MALIGKVIALTGTAYVVNSFGVRKELQLGDTLEVGDVVTTTSGSQVVLSLSEGRSITISSSQTVAFTDEISSIVNLDRVDSGVDSMVVESVIKAIESGQDVNQVLEETAAGGGSRTSYGFNFVNLLRVDDVLNQFNFDYGYDYDGLLDPLPVSERLINLPLPVEAMPVNDPIARADAFTVAEDSVLIGTVADNDTPSEEGGNVWTLDTNATNGTVVMGADGSYTYTPNPNYNGPDSFTYTITDINGDESTSAVSIDVSPANDGPVAVGDNITVVEDTPFTSTIDLDANDTDIDNDPLAVVPGTFTTAQGGTIVIQSDGSYSYTPPADYNGTDSVDYTVTDGNGGTDTATLNISVTPVIDVVSITSGSVAEDGGITHTVTLDGVSNGTTVPFAFTGGTATQGLDYDVVPTFTNGVTLSGGVLTIPAGVTTFQVIVDTLSDNIYESPDETYNLTIGDTTAVGTIIDDAADAPEVASISTPTVTEGGNLDYTVTLSNESTAPTTVTLTPSSGTGTFGADTTSSIEVSFDGGATFTTVTGATVDVPPGTATFITRIPTTDDNIGEANETILLSANTTGQTPVTGTGTISDNDSLTFNIDDAERNEAAGTITFTVSLGIPTSTPISVDYATVSGSATVGTDVLAGADPLNGTLTFPVSATGQTQTITLNIADDGRYEGLETFSVNLSNPTGGALIGASSGTGTITDDGTGSGGADNDSTDFSIGDVSISEGGLMTFTVTRTGDAADDQTIDFATSIAGGDSAEGADYADVNGTLTFASGVTTQTFTVQTAQDAVFEGSETFTATLSNNSTGSTISGATATGTIVDDGTGPGPFGPSGVPDNDSTDFSIGDVSISEGGLMTFTVTRTGDAADDQTIDFATSIAGGDSAEGADYADVNGTLTFASGVTTQTFTVQTAQDAVFEGSETFTATLSNNSTGSTISGATATGTIVDDGTGPGPFGPSGVPDNDSTDFSIGDVSISEGGLMTFTVTRTGDAADDQTIDFATSIAGGDSAEGADYADVNGTLTFASGVTTQTFTVQTAQDAVFEGSETFTATLSNNSTGSTISGATATGTIVDDGTGPGPFGPSGVPDNDSTDFSIGDVSISEGGLMTFTVTRTGDAADDQTIDFATSIAGGDSAEGADYADVNGTLTFASGVTTQTFTVQTAQDAVFEGSETFTATLSNNSTGSTISGATATGTIVDDGTGPGPFGPSGVPDNDSTSFSIADANITEGGLMTFTVTRTGDADDDQIVNFATSIGGADTAGTGDFTGNSGSLTFAAGVTTQTFTVQTTQDAVFENPETFTATLTGSSAGSTIAVPTAIGTIIDDDTTNFSIGDVSISEGGLMTFTVTRGGAAGVEQTVDFATSIAGGDTAEGADYTDINGTLTFASGVTTQTFTVQTAQDTVFEGSETFTATLSNNSAGSTISIPTATGTIVDDGTGAGPFNPGPGADNDTPTLDITGPVTVNEAAGTLTYTINMSNASTAPVSVTYGTADGSATAGSDYVASTGTVTFAAGETSKTITVDITDDLISDNGETYTVNLSAPTGGATIGTGTVTTTINDDGTGALGTGGPATDDTPEVASITSPSVAEGGDLDYIVTLSNESTTPTTVTLTPNSGTGTLGTDTDTTIEVSFDGGATFTTVAGPTVSVPAGTSSFITRIPTVDDAIGEINETITLNANTAGQTPVAGTGTIVDNDTVNIVIDDVERNEGAGTITFTVSLTTPSGVPVSVDYAASSGTADVVTDITAGTDPLSGTVNFAAGVTTQTITLNITDDAVYEGSESFNIDLTNPTGGALIGDAQGVGTITDDGTGTGGSDNDTPSITLTGLPVVNEAAGTITYTATLSNASDTPVTVDYGTANGGATAGADFTASNGTLTFAPGTTTQTFTVDITDDTVFEGPENFTANLTNPTGATIGTATVTTTINDDGTGALPPGNPGPATDDTPSLDITGPVTVNEAAGTLTYTINMSSASTAPVSVTYGTADGSATAGSDYVASTGTVTFAAGETSKTITVDITDDLISDNGETYTVNLSAPTGGATIGTGTVTTTINDDGTGALGTGGPVTDDTPSITLTGLPVVNEAAGTITYTATLSNASDTPVTVDYGTANGGATAGADFTASNGTLTFAPGTTTQTFTVDITDDTVFEGPENFTANLTNPTGATIGTATVTTTINDDGTGALPPGNPGPATDDTPSLDITGPVTVNEAAGTLTYTINMSSASTAPVSVTYGTADGSATAGSDYVASTGTVTFAAGETSKTITVDITDDLISDNGETYTVNLSAPTGGATIGTGTVTTTINDDGTGALGTGGPVTDDTPSITLTGLPVVNEAAGTITYTATLSNASDTPVTVDYGTANGGATAGADFTASNGTLTFAPGTTTQTFTVDITDDTVFEGPENFTANLTNPTGATIGTATVTTTINDDGTGALPPGNPGPATDDTPSLDITGPVTVNEAAGTLTYTINMSSASTAPVSVTYGTADGSATAGSDYVASTGTVTFAAGETSKTITVDITDDLISDNGETYTVNLSAPTGGATIGTGTVTTTINDDGTGALGTGGPVTDDTPSITLTGLPVVNEAAGTITYTATLSNASDTPVTVDYGTANGGATAGADFTASNGTLTFAPGTTTQTFTVDITDDTVFEGPENFTANLTNPTGATIGTATVTTTINDDGTGALPPGNPGPATDDTPSLDITGPVTVNEAAGTLTYTINMSSASTAPVSVTYGTADGSATAGSDYVASTGTVTFAAGETSKTITVDITDDLISDNGETYTVNLSAPTGGATIGTGTVTTTINDDGTGALGTGGPVTDDTPSITLTGLPVVNEAAGTITYTATLSNASDTPVTVDYGTANGGATAGADFTASNGTLTFAPGTTTQTFTVDITDDTVFEGPENFTANLTNPTGATIGTATVTTTINDDGTGALPPGNPGPATDDTPSLDITGPVTVNEAAGTLTYTINMSSASTAPVSVTYGTADGSATAGSDYVASTGTVTFAAGETSKTITVDITDDLISDNGETYTVNLSAPTGGATIGTGTVTTTINDDGTGALGTGGPVTDDTPSITLTGLPVVNEAAGTITYTATLSNASDTPVTVDYGTANGGATAGADFTASNGTLTFAPGTTTQTFTVDITDDTVFEGPENFTANLTNPTGATIGTATVTTTINDDGTGALPPGNPGPATDDTPIVASVTSPSVTEGGDLDYTVTLSNESTTPTTVTLTTTSGTGTVGVDTNTPIEVSFDNGVTFTTTGSSVTVPAGTTSFITRIPTVDDSIAEGDETILLSANVTGQTIVTGTGTIGDNEPTIDLDGDDSSGGSSSGYTTTFTENAVAVSVADVDVNVVDPIQTNMTGATVTLTNAQVGDVLSAGAMPSGITASVVGNVVTLSGSASLASYEAAIQAVTFSNSTENPNTTPRIIEVVANNGTDDTNTATTTVNVVAINDAPINTVPGAQSATEDTPLLITGLRINDVDDAGQTMTVTLTITNGTLNVTGGSAAVVGSGTNTVVLTGSEADIDATLGANVTYVQTANFNGVATLTMVTDDQGNTGIGGALTDTDTVTINVASVNDAPVAVDDTVTVNEDVPFNSTVDLDTNDTDLDGDALTVVPETLTTAQGGTIVIAADGSYTYTPPANYSGSDSVNYTVTDGDLTDVGTLNITVNPVNDAPVAVDDTVTVNEDVPFNSTVDLDTNDTDLDGDALTVVPETLTTAQGGTIVIAADGSYTYTPPANYSGSDSVNYTVTDGDLTDVGTLNITVNSVNDAPTTTGSNNVGLEDAAAIPVVLQGSDLDGTIATYSLSSLPTNGALYTDAALTTLAATGVDYAATGEELTLYFVPQTDFNNGALGGSVVPSFEFTATDNEGLESNVATESINVTPVDDGVPVTEDDSYSTLVGTPITFTLDELLANDTLLDHAAVSSTFTPANLPADVTYNAATETFTYTPTATSTGSFSYTVTDDEGQPRTATVNLSAFNTSDDLITVQEAALPDGNGTGVDVITGNLFANDTGSLTGNITALNNNGVAANLAGNTYTLDTATGTLVVDRVTGDYTYTLNTSVDNDSPTPAELTSVSAIEAIQTFTYTRAGGGTANLRVTIEDDGPTATNATVQVSEGALPAYNIVMMLDVSGSMTNTSAGGAVRDVDENGNATIKTRLEMAQDGMRALIEEYFSQSSDVTISIGSFSTNSTLHPNSPFTSKQAALDAIDNLAGPGGTNYEAGLNQIQNAFGTPDPTESNVVYFISDGAPSQGDTVNPVGASGYDTFLANNPSVDSYAIGIGSGISDTAPLDSIHNVDTDGSGATDSAIMVADLNNLESALLATIPNAFGGNLVTAGGQSNVTFGADGGNIEYIDIMLDSNADVTTDTSVRFTYDPVTNEITEDAAFITTGFPVSGDVLTLTDVEGFPFGTLVFNFGTGDYTYFTGGAAPEGTSFDIGFQVIDNDGDTASAIQTIEVIDGRPVAKDDFDTLLQNQAFFEGNVVSGTGTDGSDNALVTSFTGSSSGTDEIIDGAVITSTVFKGVTYDLTTDSTGTASGGNYTVTAGVLTWTSTTEPANQFTFNTTGYYKYTPPVSETTGIAPDAAVTTFFNTAGDADDNGVVLSGVQRDGNLNNPIGVDGNNPDGSPSFSNYNGTNRDGAGVNGGDGDRDVDNLETLIIEFNRDATQPASGTNHLYGVQNVIVHIAPNGSNLGDNGSGIITSVTYTIYDISGNKLGQFASIAEGDVSIPAEYSNIGRIEVEANSAADARVGNVTFQSSNVDNTATAIAPEEIQYTLTDVDGDTSTATLRMTVESNHFAGTDAANDNLTGTAANDYISGLGGDDTIFAGAGADIINGGSGVDNIQAQAGDDQVFAGDDADTVSGGTGDDLIYGQDGNDILDGDDGADKLYGGAGDDTIDGGIGNDTIVGGQGVDILTGGPGSDTFVWNLGDQGVKGAPVNDTVTDFDASAGGDVLDFRDLLVGESHTGTDPGNLASFLHFEKSGTDTIIHLSSNGEFAAGFDASKDVQTITLSGVDLVAGYTNDQQVIQDMLSNNQLIVD